MISEALFAALVLMALVTTFMAGPVLNRLDPKNEFGEPVEAELDRAREETAAITPMPIPEQSILVAPQTEAALAQLLAVAVPLATSEPPRELIIARLIEPPRGASVRGGLQTERFQLAEAAREVDRVRADLLARGVPARAVAFTSTDVGARPGQARRARGRRSRARSTAAGRSAATASRAARSARSCAGRPATSRSSSRARTRSSRRAPTRRWSCPSAAPSTTGPRSSSARGWPRPPARRCACWARPARARARRTPAACWPPPRCSCSASSGVAAEPLLAEPGREGLLQAAAGAGLLVIGLSDRWREEGLGPVRHEIAARRAGADPLRAPRPAPRRAGAAHRRDAVHVVARRRRRCPACPDQAGSTTRGGAWCTPDGAGRLRSSAGIWLTEENSRTSRISPGRARRLGGQQRHRLDLGRHRPARHAELAGVLDPAQRDDREDDDLGPDGQRPRQPEEPHARRSAAGPPRGSGPACR